MTEPSDHTMDSASAARFEQMFAGNHARMNHQDEQIGASGRAIQALVTQVSELTSQLQRLRGPTAPAPPPLVSPESPNINRLEPRIPTPERYSGEPNLCRAFLTKCSIYFSLQPMTFSSEESKVALVMTLLSGRAALWGTAVWQNQHNCCSSFQALKQEMSRVFDRGVAGREAACQLADLRQNNNSVSDYSIEFRTLAAECKWNEEAQWDMFLHGLADRVQREIYTLELPKTLDGLVELALRVDARLQQRETRPYQAPVGDFAEFSGYRRVNTVSPPNDPEPMQRAVSAGSFHSLVVARVRNSIAKSATDLLP
uniref:Retrotransposon gag domain-containing protein n=1 Tax=Cyprinus carpio carpio TaxID=630221 RepID=A0A9J7XMJ0_CYPCA